MIPCWLLTESSNAIVRFFLPLPPLTPHTLILHDDRFVVCRPSVSIPVPTQLTWLTNRWLHDTTRQLQGHNATMTKAGNNTTAMDNDNRQQQLHYDDRRRQPQVTYTREWHDDDCTQQRLHTATHGNTTSSEDSPLPPINANDGQRHTPPTPMMSHPQRQQRPTTMAHQHLHVRRTQPITSTHDGPPPPHQRWQWFTTSPTNGDDDPPRSATTTEHHIPPMVNTAPPTTTTTQYQQWVISLGT